MSGIVGILNLDGAPVDRDLLDLMTDSMTFRGPDAQRTWADGHVGFGHTLLKTTRESEHERQPFTLDGDLWIVADARVDGQRDLIAKLAARGEEVERGATDVELLLRAYRTWGEACVEHLIGDFAFALWDRPRRRLFCARDHFGVKPFYYAKLPHALIFSNTLDCIRQHPFVSGTLNECAVADFLVSDYNQDPGATFFADIQSLQPAHRLSCSGAGVHLGRYWMLPVDDLLRYKRRAEYVERFRDVLRTAVDDRLRTNRLAVYMSGGLDSTTLTATAHEILGKRCSSFDLRAYTVVYERLMPDQERRYSGLLGNALGIPVHYLTADRYRPFEFSTAAGMRHPEPDNDPFRAVHADLIEQVVAHSRVAFYGEGPDNLLYYEWRPYVRHLLRTFQFARFAMDVGCYVGCHRRLPLLRGIISRVKPSDRDISSCQTYPEWFNAAFASRVCLRERWEACQRLAVSRHPFRPKGSGSLDLASWRHIFERYDGGSTRLPFEVRHPFLDLRVVRYLLAVPAIPWCADKYLLRAATRKVLPEAIRLRPKAPLSKDALSEHLRQWPEWVHKQPHFVPPLSEYVDERAVRDRALRADNTVSANWSNVRPFALNRWLSQSA
jgi:asparagine synthase (glutamine-hydrolysing)